MQEKQQTDAENSPPKKPQEAWPRFAKTTVMTLRYTLVILLILFISLVVLIQLPFFQTYVLRQALYYATEKLDFRINASGIYIDLINSHLYLEKLSVHDPQNHTMIYIESLDVDFEYTTVFKNNQVLLQNVQLDRGSINLVIDKKTEELNIDVFIDNVKDLLASKDQDTTKKSEPVKFIIQKAQIIDTYFGYSDDRRPYDGGEYIDFNHFGVDELNAQLENFSVLEDVIETRIQQLNGLEPSLKFPIKHLSTYFRLSDRTMDFQKLNLRAGNSRINRELRMAFSDIGELSDFENEVTIIAFLDSTVIDTEDLALFAPGVKVYEDVWRVSGEFRGRVNDFSFKKMDLFFGEDSHIHGEVDFSGLPDIEKTFMQLEFEDSELNVSELGKYIPQADIIEVLNRFGRLRFDANFIGFVSDFVADGSFRTDIGNFSSDINLKLKENRQQSYYKGSLKTNRLNIGRLFVLPNLLGTINMNGNIEGTGFQPSTARFKLDAQIQELVFNRYAYHDIEVDAELSSQRFDGKLFAEDPNFNLEAYGVLDLNKDLQQPDLPAGRFDLKTDIRKVSLKPLNFSPKETILQAKLEMDSYGLNLDSITGEAVLSEAFFYYNKKGIHINSAEFLAFLREEGGRFFRLDSEFLDFEAFGNFRFSTLLQDLQDLAYEYALSFRNDPEEIETYYRKKREKLKGKPPKNYQADFTINLKNVNPILAVFTDVKRFNVSNNTHLKGRFYHDPSSTFSLYTEEGRKIDSLQYDQYTLYDVHLDVNTFKAVDSTDILAQALISSSRQRFIGTSTENLSLDAVWASKQIDFEFYIDQAKSSNYANLLGSMRFEEDTTLIGFQPSNFQFLEEKWNVSDQNIIKVSRNYLEVHDLEFYKKSSKNSKVSIKGIISNEVSEPLRVLAQDINILPFADFFAINMKGLLNADINISDVYQTPNIAGDISIDNLEYNEVLFGDIYGATSWNNKSQSLNLNLDVRRFRRPILEVNGTYSPLQTENSLNLVADLIRTDLEVLEPFVSIFASNLRGSADGQLNITGTIQEPVVLGKISIENAQLRINYLNTLYQADANVIFERDQIIIQGGKLIDEGDHPATLEAILFHDGFNDFYLSLGSDFYNFQVLNTTAQDNDLFYGTAYGTGTLRIEGFLNNLKMDINATSKKGTKISLPLDGYEEVSERSYIQFVKDNRNLEDSSDIQKVNLGGIEVNLNLNVTKDAEFEIIFDLKAGDVIRGYGRGDIKMRVSTEGDFEMFGYYVIEKGRYNFTFANLVNKGFDIQSGSNIAFNGDVYASRLDIRAIYTKYVTLRPLIDIETVPDPESSEYRRPYEVSAILELKGDFLNPEIKLDLDLAEAKKTPNTYLQTAVYQLDTKIQNDEQERNRQVFSLLILNRISPLNSFRGGGVGSTAGSSLSELISNQFSNWISQVDENLELSVDVDANDFNTFQLRVSYSLLDGQLRVSRDGGFTNAQNQADFASIVGDWTVEYLLTPGGKYRIKMFNRTNQNVINNVNLDNSNSTTTAGFSFLYTANFNTFRDLFTSHRKAEEQRIKELQEEDNEELVAFRPPPISNDFPSFDTSQIKNEDSIRISNLKKERITLSHRFDTFTQGGRVPSSENPSNNTITSPSPLVRPEDDQPKPRGPLFPLPHRFDSLKQQEKRWPSSSLEK